MTKMTKAQLIDENINLRATLAHLEAQLASMTTAQPAKAVVITTPVGDKPEAVDFEGYWDYVRAAKAWCNKARKPVRYLSREQFVEAHAAYDDAMESDASSYVEFPHGEFPPQCNVGPLN